MSNIEVEGLVVHQAKGLPEGWTWHDWDDDSGGLRTPDGVQYMQYDAQTSELRFQGKQWEFFDGYPYETESLSSVKKRVENHAKNTLEKESAKDELLREQQKSVKNKEAR